MERIQENEQWKLDGDCRKCRRAKYCTDSSAQSKDWQVPGT